MSDERLEDLLEALQAIVWEATASGDAELVLTYLNAGAAGLIPFSGDPQAGFRTLLRDDDRARVLAQCSALNASAPRLPVEVRVFAADGQHRWFAGDVHLLSAGPPRRVRGIVTNVTELRQAVELDVAARRDLEEQLRQSQKMEAVGRLAAGVAHDFNNLLLLVSGHAEVLMEEVAAGSRAHRAADAVQKATERAALLTQQLLAFSKRQALKPRVVDVNDLIGGMTTLLQTLLHEDIELVVERGAHVSLVIADPTQIERVILNLAVNARDAMPDGGTLRIAIGGVTLDSALGRRAGDLKSGRYVQVLVADTGAGMNAETQLRVFEPFFTTKPRGTGLGLASAYGIVGQSGGHISVSSAPGRGTTFTLLLPQVDAAEESMPLARPDGTPVRCTGDETVLLVEDEDAVRSLLRESLEGYGYTVLEARGGAEALAAAGWHRETLDLLVTDLIMPQMGGVELVERLRAERPELRVLYITGYNDREIAPAEADQPHVELLRKPFTGREFARRVRDILDRKIDRLTN